MKSKKELKNKYLQMKPEMGVFEIRNNIDNRVLIDRSTNVNSKWNRHKTELNFNSHKNKELQRDWNKFGENSFSFSVLSKLEYNDELTVNYSEELKLLESLLRDEFDQNNIQEY